MRIFEISRPETHGNQKCLTAFDGRWLQDEFDGAEIGDSITVTLRDMTLAEIDALPEFRGW